MNGTQIKLGDFSDFQSHQSQQPNYLNIEIGNSKIPLTLQQSLQTLKCSSLEENYNKLG
jgi:hypothetical protein